MRRGKFWNELKISSLETIFPALTCPVQASFRTASEPFEHGICANGFFSREIRKTFFWEQSSSLVRGGRIWDSFRVCGGRVGQLCWQNSIGNDSDMILSPAPIHKHHGGMIQDFYSRPSGLYRELCRKLGSSFNLFNYWGPFTSLKSSRWIARAAASILKSDAAPDLFLVYLPHLDYDLQKFGPDSHQAKRAFAELELLLGELIEVARHARYDLMLFGDYAIGHAETAIFPNRALLEKSFFSCREVKGMLYPDLWSSRAFALADHQIAHVYVENPDDKPSIREIFRTLTGVAQIHETHDAAKSRFGDFVLEATPGYWFAYQWWNNKSEAPDYATHVDIHNKPGYDPCELFLSLWPPFSSSMETNKIKGTHGLSKGHANQIFFGTNIDFGNFAPTTLVEMASLAKNMLA